jgi:phage terminase large subunit-like protein
MPINPISMQISITAFLEDVQDRLRDDIDPYFDRLRELNAAGKYPGNWAVVRMLMPVIEAVAVATETDQPQNGRPYILLEKLGVPYPAVVWDMYRNGLSHSEQPFSIIYKNKRIVWSITTTWDDPAIKSHSVTGQLIHINLKTLYEDFKEYIKGRLREADADELHEQILTIKTGKIYPDDYSGPLRDALESLIS